MASVSEFIKYCQQALNEKWGYIWGQSGDVWTQTKQNALVAKYNSDPSKYADYKLGAEYGSKWIGKRVADCSGLLKWAAKQCGFTLPHGSNSMHRNYLTKTGLISDSSVPIGAAVFKLKNKTDWYHVGIYIGDNKVIEAQGTKTGVVTSKLSSWYGWGMLKGLDYEGDSMEKEKDTVSVGKAVVDVPDDTSVNVRKSGSLTSSRITTLPEGTEVDVLSVNGNWSKIRYAIPAEGYVMTKFLRKK